MQASFHFQFMLDDSICLFFIKSEKSVPDFNLLKLFQKLELQAYCPSVIVFLRFYFLLLFCSILSAI